MTLDDTLLDHVSCLLQWNLIQPGRCEDPADVVVKLKKIKKSKSLYNTTWQTLMLHYWPSLMGYVYKHPNNQLVLGLMAWLDWKSFM